MWSILLFAGCLWIVSAALALLQVLSWRSTRRHAIPEAELAFYRRQHRRRMQINLLIALVGCAAIASIWIKSTYWEAVLWSVLILVVVYIVVLAFLDALSAQRHYTSVSRRNRQAHQAELQQLIEKLRSQNNGHQKS